MKYEYKVIAIDGEINQLAKLWPDKPRHLLIEQYFNDLGSQGWRIFELRGDVVAMREVG